jgi:hypothetical protein
MSLAPTQRWWVRTRWLQGESVAALALDYGVSVEEVQAQVDQVSRHAQASVPKPVAVREPESGMRCSVCGTHRYGLGDPSLLPGTWIMRCHKCGRRTPHRAI